MVPPNHPLSFLKTFVDSFVGKTISIIHTFSLITKNVHGSYERIMVCLDNIASCLPTVKIYPNWSTELTKCTRIACTSTKNNKKSHAINPSQQSWQQQNDWTTYAILTFNLATLPLIIWLKMIGNCFLDYSKK